MKKYLLSLLLIAFFGMLNAQEMENPRFNLTDSSVTGQLELVSNPVSEMDLNIQIFTAEMKNLNSSRIEQNLTVLRGKTTHSMDVSDLPPGDYFIEISQEKNGRIYRKQFTKE